MFRWDCAECDRVGGMADELNAARQAHDHNAAKHGCTCEWYSIFEGEAGGVSYHIGEPDKRCMTHGKPRHVAK